MANSKKVHFSKSSILKIFLWKLHGLVLGLVELIDAKGIDVAQLTWSNLSKFTIVAKRPDAHCSVQ